MTAKEKADCLLELHKSQLQHFMQTRDIELKVDIALWTLIAASGSFLHGKTQLNGISAWIIYAVVTLAIVLGHMFLWKKPIQSSEDTDDYFINQYRKEIEKLTGVLIQKPSTKKRPSWILAQSGITLILLVVVGFLLSA